MTKKKGKMGAEDDRLNPEDDEVDGDLICDALETEANGGRSGSGKRPTFKGCLRSCCPKVLNGLKKIKVAEMAAFKAITVNEEQLKQEAEQLNIIERIDAIRKPFRDQHSYRYIELKNGLRVLMASNPNGKTSAAALDIKVGSFHDPNHLQGLAHLCEHVLFTGSEVFPNESYSSFLGQRGGSSNAYTTSEHTNFHFEVPSDHFVEALRRFVSFFQCPILRESSIQNELEIIQSEHEKNRWNDVWRINQVERATANPGHVFGHFSTGTRQSLTVDKGAEMSLRYELFQFFKNNYSANIMCMCLVHNASLDKMEDLVRTHLMALQNKNVPERIWPSRPFKPKQMRIKIFVVPVKEVCHVNLTFPMEDISSYYAAGPAGQVAQLIGHKGQNGLFSYLKAKGWAHQLVASHKTLGKGFSLFMISVQLTDTGEKFVDEVIKHVFQYVQILKITGPLQWFYDELKYLSDQQFQQQDVDRPQNQASNAALWLHMYPAKEVWAADYLLYEWRPDLIERIYAYLCPDNVRVAILTKKAKFFATQVEPHFGTEYHVEKIPNDVLDSWRNSGANDDLKVPRPNDLMDKSPKMVAFDCQREHAMPELVLHMERIRMRAWYLPNTKLKLTKAFTFIKFSIVDPSMDQHPGCKIDTPKMACINSLFAFLVRDRLTEHSYKAQLAGLFYKLWPTRTGLELEVRGSSGKQDLFLRQLLNVIYDLGNETFKEERFKQVHDLHVNGLQSGEANKLKMQAKNILAHILCPGNHLRHSRLEAMGQIEADQVKQYARIFLLNHSVECFFYGNLCLEGVNRMTNAAIEARRDFLQAFAKDLGICQDVHEAELHLEDWFRNDPVNQIVLLEKSIQTTAAANDAKTNLDHDQVLDEAVVNPIEEDNDNAGEEDDTKEPSEAEDNNNRIMEYSLSKMSNGSRHIVIVNNEIQSSSCVLYFFQYSSNRALESSKLELFFHLVQVQLISTMKHVVPLGYVVGCDIRKVNDSLGFRITVESQYPLMVVYRTIEEALEDLDDYLANMTLEDFDMSKNAVLSVKAESMTSLTDQAHALWREIQDETYDFDRHAKELVQLERLDLMDVRTFYRQWIHSKARERRSLVVSISPDPILNRLDPGPRIHHWTLDQVEQLRSDMGTPIRGLPVPLEWFNSIFECSENIYEPPLP